MSESLAYPSRREIRVTAARHATRGRATARRAGSARHATPRGDGFGALVGLTALGLVPGASLVAAGRRRTGWTLLTLFVLGVAAIVGIVLSGRGTTLGLRLATRPTALMALAGALAGIGVLWALTILIGHVLLRRNRLTTPQGVLAGVLVVALMALVLVPTATGAQYAMAQRSLILTVFDDDGEILHGGEATRQPKVQEQDPWADTPRINVLMLGSDAGAGRTGTRTDTMIVASIDTETGDTVLFSLPRNLENPPFAAGTPGARQFPGGFAPSSDCSDGSCYLNAVWTWAEGSPGLFPGDDNRGLTATSQAISGVLGLPIDYYAVVNLRGFIDLVNAIGGVEITVQRRVPIGGIDQAGNEITPDGYIEPGRQVLNGYNAQWYARSRSGSDDYDRIKRQRCTIAAVVDQADPARLALSFPQLAASAERNVQTSIQGVELEAFIELGQRVKDGELRSLPFTNEVINSGSADFAAIRALVQQAIEPPPPPPPAETTPAPTPSGGASPGAPTPSETVPAPPPPPDPSQPADVDEVCA